MAVKYWRLTFRGERSLDDLRAELGRNGATLLRIQVEDGKTQIYFSGDKATAGKSAKAIKSASAKEVRAADVTRIK